MSGDCFEVAAGLVIHDNENKYVLVHGTVLSTTRGGTAPIGYRHAHAWVEYESTFEHESWPQPIVVATCVDKANGNDVELPAALYYKVGHVQVTGRYARWKAIEMMAQTGNYGPWKEGE